MRKTLFFYLLMTFLGLANSATAQEDANVFDQFAYRYQNWLTYHESNRTESALQELRNVLAESYDHPSYNTSWMAHLVLDQLREDEHVFEGPDDPIVNLVTALDQDRVTSFTFLCLQGSLIDRIKQCPTYHFKSWQNPKTKMLWLSALGSLLGLMLLLTSAVIIFLQTLRYTPVIIDSLKKDKKILVSESLVMGTLIVSAATVLFGWMGLVASICLLLCPFLKPKDKGLQSFALFCLLLFPLCLVGQAFLLRYDQNHAPFLEHPFHKIGHQDLKTRINSYIEQNPSDAIAHFKLGELLMLDKDFQGAEDSFAKAHEADNHWSKPLNNIAYLKKQAGDLESVEPWLEQSIAANSKDIVPIFNLHRWLNTSAKLEQARKYLRMGREADLKGFEILTRKYEQPGRKKALVWSTLSPKDLSERTWKIDDGLTHKWEGLFHRFSPIFNVLWFWMIGGGTLLLCLGLGFGLDLSKNIRFNLHKQRASFLTTIDIFDDQNQGNKFLGIPLDKISMAFKTFLGRWISIFFPGAHLYFKDNWLAFLFFVCSTSLAVACIVLNPDIRPFTHAIEPTQYSFQSIGIFVLLALYISSFVKMLRN